MEKLFFIAIIPHKSLADEITAIKHDFAHRFDSRRALRIMPHITLAPPFKLFEGKRKGLIEWFGKLTFSVKPFDVSLNGFGAFDKAKNPVIYINPEHSQSLIDLQRQLTGKLQDLLPREKAFTEPHFHPHMTVAYRDLKPEHFGRAWAEYQSKPFAAGFAVSAIHLLEHDGSKWNIIASKNL